MNSEQRKKRGEKERTTNFTFVRLFLFFLFAGFCINAGAYTNRANELHPKIVDLDMGYYNYYCATNVIADIRVKNETIVKNDKLVLGNIAEITSNDVMIVERLRSISLGYAPNVGAVRELQRDRIFMAIASAGFSTSDFSFESPSLVRIRRASQNVDSKLIREVVANAVLNPLKTVGAETELTRLDIPVSVEVPTGEVEVRASSGKVRDLFSSFSISIEILVDGRVVKRISAMAQVEATMPVVVAARDIQSNERIKETDVRVETRKLSKPVTNYFRDFSKLRGTDSSRPIAKGEIVTSDSMIAGIVIKAGDSVRLIYNSGGMQIIVMGEARALGRIGDRIQVKNTQSGTFLQAIIVDEGIVRVN